jgi:nicotinamide mononucleotide adenylyltransferase
MYPINKKKNNFIKNNINCPLSITHTIKHPVQQTHQIQVKESNIKTEFYWEKLKQKYPYDSDKKYCIFFNGCCCPPHKGHIDSIREARDMFPGCKVIVNQLGASKRHGIPSEFNSYLLKKYLIDVFDSSSNIKYMFREKTRTIFSHEFIMKADVVIIVRGEEFEEFDNIIKVINEKNVKNADRYKKYIKKLNNMGIKVDFIYQSRPIDKVSATKFMEKLDEYKYKHTLNMVKKDDLYELMNFIPNEVKSKDKYKIIKKILLFNTYV